MIIYIWFSRFCKIVHDVHDFLNISLGKRRLRQSIYELFIMKIHEFSRILIFSLFVHQFLGEKAPVAEYL